MHYIYVYTHAYAPHTCTAHTHTHMHLICSTLGLAFCALVHAHYPEKIPFNDLKPENKEYHVTFSSIKEVIYNIEMYIDII